MQQPHLISARKFQCSSVQGRRNRWVRGAFDPLPDFVTKYGANPSSSKGLRFTKGVFSVEFNSQRLKSCCPKSSHSEAKHKQRVAGTK